MIVDRAEADMVYGLLKHYKCRQCGWCCKNCPPQLKGKELTRFRKLTRSEDWLDKEHLKAPCVFLNTDSTCRVHSERPTICKLYPVMPVIIPEVGHQVVSIQAVDYCPLAKEISNDLADFVKNQLKRPWKRLHVNPTDKKEDTDLREVVPFNIFATFARWKSKEENKCH